MFLSRALFLSWPITSLLSLCSCAAGLVMFAYFRHCDPLHNGQVSKADQLLPYLVMKLFGQFPGLPGLFIAGIFSGALSTVSSFVNSLAAVTLEDYVKPLCSSRKHPLSDTTSVFLGKLLACFYGLVCLAVTYLVQQMNSLLEGSLTIFGVVGGPLLGLFTLGMCTKKCSSSAAVLSFLVSLAFGIFMGFGALTSGLKPTPLATSIDGCDLSLNHTYLERDNSSSQSQDDVFYLFRVSYMWYAGLTWTLSLLVAWLFTLFRPNTEQVDDHLLCPLFRPPLTTEHLTQIVMTDPNSNCHKI